MMNRERQSRNQTKVLRVLRAFAVKVQPRIHREAAKGAKISRRKILSCQQRIFGLVVQMNTERPRRNQKASPQRRAERGGSSLERTLPASGVRRFLTPARRMLALSGERTKIPDRLRRIFSLVVLICVHLWFHSYFWSRLRWSRKYGK